MAVSRTNRRLLLGCVAVSVVMFGFGYLLVPLYASLCRVVGLNRLGTADAVASETRPDMNRTVLMQFDSNLRDGLPWVFRPLQATLTVHPGQLVRVAYEARNDSERTIIGQAVASYAPDGAAAYVRKLQCFCFTTQKLAPHEVREMPVLFLIDRSLPREVSTLTLSYTFFDVGGASVAPVRQGT